MAGSLGRGQFIRVILFCLTVSMMINSCQNDDDFWTVIEEIPEQVPEGEDMYIHDQPANEGVANALAKARLVAGIEWTPLAPVPSVYGKKYPAGETRKGLPYSLAQKVNGYVGLDVSFYTFLTAVHNPYSVMYTENLASYPYYGFDCAPYYGSVCSTSVWYVLGIKAPYYTSAIQSIPELKKKGELNSDSISLCDVLWSKGHVAMVYDIARDIDSLIHQVTVFETTRTEYADSRLIKYSLDDFLEKWNKVGWIIYRPKDLSLNPSPNEPFLIGDTQVQPTFSYNNYICTSRGDRVSYPIGDDVVINLISNQYPEMELYRNEELYEKRSVNSNAEAFTNLPYGDYKARLVGNGFTSDFTYFEVIDTNVSYDSSENGNLTVYFSSKNAIPEVVSQCDERDCPYYCYVLTPSNLSKGSISFTKATNYIKVLFRGKYGRVSNKSMTIK